MWIKICGMTTPEAVSAALEARVDAIGFVFAESSRQLTPQRAARLAQAARGRVRCVAVTRHPAQATVDEILRVFGPDALQTDLSDLDRLQLPAGLELLPVVRAAQQAPATLPGRILFEGPMSGTGVASDWNAARRLARCTQLVLAGGLNTGNVAAAIAAVQPFGVDVSSGVEVRPGMKSPTEIVYFAAAARAASEDPA
jgi:phosphoribosylanthranilate isomerase